MKTSEVRKKEIIDYCFFALLSLGMTVLLVILAYRQAINVNSGIYKSDILAYMQHAQGIDSGYSFPYPIFFALIRLIHNFTSIEMATALAEGILNLVALMSARIYLDKYIEDRSLWQKFLASILIIAGFMLSMIVTPGDMHLPHKYNTYLGIFTGNPWHNATYIATRPFAIITFFSFAELLEQYEKKLTPRVAIGFAISLFLTTHTKPSFTIVLGSSALIIFIFRLVKSKFKNIKHTLLAGLCFLPTIADLLRQYSGVFVAKEDSVERGIGFCFFDVWKLSNVYVAEAVIYANVFSIVCLIIFFKDLKQDILYRLALVVFLVSLLEAGCLCEKGFRYQDFNFCWGYMHGIFFFELVSLFKLIKASFDKERKAVFLACGWGAFCLQLASGVYYFVRIFSGFTYE